MTIRINLLPGASARGGALGLLTDAGNPWTLDDALGADLVNRGLAIQVDPLPTPATPVTTDGNKLFADGKEISSLVSGGGVPVIDATRASINGATDTDELTLATLVIPGGILQRGSIIEVFAIFENTSSASTKTLTLRVDGTSVASYTTTTNQAYGIRFPIHVQDAGSVIMLNNGSVGVGGTSGLSLSKAIAGVRDVGFTITLTCKWNAAVAGEFIRLKHGKFKVTF